MILSNPFDETLQADDNIKEDVATEHTLSENRCNIGSRSSEEAVVDQKAARRRRRSQATNFTLCIYVCLYILLLLRPESKSDHSSSSSIFGTNRTSRASTSGKSAILLHGRYLSKSTKTPLHSAVMNHDFSAFSCESLNDLTTAHDTLSSESVCDFARTCNDGDGIFAPIVFCHPTLSTRTLLLLLSPPLIFFLTILFRVLGSTAEEFFSPGLEMFSLKLGLPERFAGVTLLALGNGAPDVASTVSAINGDRRKGYLMALGELTGAAMVSSTLIVGAVVHIAGGVPCHGAMVRDVVFFIVTMAVVYECFEDGSITVEEIKFFVGIYGVYVILVLGSDLHHKLIHSAFAEQITQNEVSAGNEKESEQVEEASEETLLVQKPLQRLAYSEPTNSSKDVGIGAKVPMIHTETRPLGVFGRMMEFISNYDNNSSLSITNDKEKSCNDLEGAASRSHNHEIFRFSTVKESIDEGWGAPYLDGNEPLIVFHPHHGGLVDLKRATSADHSHLHHKYHDTTRTYASSSDMDLISTLKDPHDCKECLETQPGIAPDDWVDAFKAGGRELINYWIKFRDETFFSDEYKAIEKFFLACEMPFTLLRMITIPVPCDGYYCRPLVALSIAGSPFWMWFYCYNQYSMDFFGGSSLRAFLVLLGPALLALSVLRYAPCGDVPMRASISVPITIIGFIASATWLDFISDLLVSLLSFFGIILHIPATIMGLTFLAWGNASQDLIANTTVAKKGLSAMAITASFAGPVFNILIGLGIGLTLLTQESGHLGEPILVSLNNTLRVGFAFTVANGVLVILSGLCLGKGTIPQQYGYFAMFLYAIYAIASIVV